MIEFKDVKAAATGRWHGILVGIGITPELLSGKHQPCPCCGGKDTFRWDRSKEVFCCGKSDMMYRDGFDLLNHAIGLSAADALKEVAGFVGIKKDLSPESRIKYAKRRAALQREKLEKELDIELTALMLVRGNRDMSRRRARTPLYKGHNPEFQEMPDEFWEREELAAKKIRELLGKIYTL